MSIYLGAVEQLAVEFSRAGADITQTFSFWCHEKSLPKGCKYTVSIILYLFFHCILCIPFGIINDLQYVLLFSILICKFLMIVKGVLNWNTLL